MSYDMSNVVRLPGPPPIPLLFRVAVPSMNIHVIYGVLSDIGVPSYCCGYITIGEKEHTVWDLESAKDAKSVRELYNGVHLTEAMTPPDLIAESHRYRRSPKYLNDLKLIEEA